jgi:hypothetical protein
METSVVGRRKIQTVALGAVLFFAGGTFAGAVQGAYTVEGSSIIELPTETKAIAAATAAATIALQQRCNGYANLRETGTLIDVKHVLQQTHPEVGGVLVTVRLSGSCIVSTATPVPGTFRPAPATTAVPLASHGHSNRPGASASPNSHNANGNGANGNGGSNGNNNPGGMNGNGNGAGNTGPGGPNGNANPGDLNGGDPNVDGRH